MFNRHTTGCLLWTCPACTKKCQTDYATKCVARLTDYDAWYTSQWEERDEIIATEERQRKARAWLASKRRCLQQRAFKMHVSFKSKVFSDTPLTPANASCAACNKWIKHDKYSKFKRTERGAEQWWQPTIENSSFLKRFIAANKQVNWMVICHNCATPCLNCKTVYPRSVLKVSGLCNQCNTDDEYFLDPSSDNRWLSGLFQRCHTQTRKRKRKHKVIEIDIGVESDSLT